jgi:hypothetical protein
MNAILGIFFTLQAYLAIVLLNTKGIVPEVLPEGMVQMYIIICLLAIASCVLKLLKGE